MTLYAPSKIAIAPPGETLELPAKIQITTALLAPAKIAVVNTVKAAPRNVLVVPNYDGVAYIQWEDDTDPWRYEIFFAWNEGGEYELLATTVDKRMWLTGLPVNTPFFLKVRGEYVDGDYSDFAEALLGRASLSVKDFRILGLSGTEIKSGAVFPFVDKVTGSPIPVEAQSDITL